MGNAAQHGHTKSSGPTAVPPTLSSLAAPARIARDGDAAIRTMEAETPDLVLLDVALPRRDGLDVCRAIRAEARWRDVRVIMLTARGRELDRRKGLETGADDYILKPFSTSEVVQRVESLLAQGPLPSRAGEDE